MEASLQNNTILFSVSQAQVQDAGQSISFLPYQDLVVEAISDFSNNMLSYAAMLEIAKQEVELLLIAKANNPGKINIDRLIPRNVRLAILNRLHRLK